MLKLSATALAATILSLSVITPGISQENGWRFSTGTDFSSGDYGGDTSDTDITYVPVVASYRSGLWNWQATVPWVQIEGTGTVVGAGDGGVVVRNPRRDRPVPEETVVTSESGLGDIWLSGSVGVAAIPGDLFYLDLGAKVKLPTADEDKGLGTGEVDYTLQADFFKPLGNMTPFLTLAYKMRGEPTGVELDDSLYVSVGSDFRVGDTSNLGLSLDIQEAANSQSEDVLELFGYLNQELSSNWALILYGYSGLKDGSPDYGLGFQVTYNP